MHFINAFAEQGHSMKSFEREMQTTKTTNLKQFLNQFLFIHGSVSVIWAC